MTKLSGAYDLIYFDALVRTNNLKCGQLKFLRSISAVTKRNGIFVTYSAKGEVRRNLKACGFEVTLLPGPPGKRQMIRAVKI